MKTLTNLFNCYPQMVRKCYYQRAIIIQNKLNNGECYQRIGGKRLHLANELVRFKLGAYRLIFKRSAQGFIPEKLLQRKNLNTFLKRR